MTEGPVNWVDMPATDDDAVGYNTVALFQNRLYLISSKGHIIWKRLFGIFRFFQKTNEQIGFLYCQTIKMNLFVCFLEESEDIKSCFEMI